MTDLTNDLAVGYERASADRACVYSLGIYVDEAEQDRARDVTIRVTRPGLRVLHPSKFLFRSPQARRESLLRAAWSAPDLFETGIVRAHLFPLRPLGGQLWDALLSVSFPMPVGGEAGSGVSRREFGAVLRRGGAVAKRLSRVVTLEPLSPGGRAEPHVTFVERIEARPGSYELTAVLSDPTVAEPHAARVTLVVPDVPRKELFLVDPILGRPAADNLVVYGDGLRGPGDEIGGDRSFEPLLVQRLEEPTDFVSLTQACYAGAGKRGVIKAARGGRVRRALLDERGAEVGVLEPIDVTLDGEGSVRCQTLIDVVPGSRLRSGEYTFEAALESVRDEAGAPVRVRFAVAPR